MTDKIPESDTSRVSYRSEIARDLSSTGNYDGVKVLSRESVSGFGISEWKLIEKLESSDNGIVTVGSGRDYSGAINLAELGIVEIEEKDENKHQIIRKYEHVIVPIFED